jgi:enterobactin synthetase component D
MPRDAEGVLAWPAGVVGSLTHKEGLVAAAFGRSEHLLGVGLDAENPGRMKAPFEERLCNGAESKLLDELCRKTKRSREEWLTVVFSLKEALFKCLYPLGRTMFYFLDAELESVAIEPSVGTASLRLLRRVGDAWPAGFVAEGAFVWETEGQLPSVRYVIGACWVLKAGASFVPSSY